MALTWRAMLAQTLRCGLAMAVLICLSLSVAPRAGAYVYWSEGPPGCIGRARVDGSGVNVNFLHASGNCYGLADDGSYLYWSDDHGIERANVDGTGAIVTLTSTGGSEIAVDREHLYWTNSAVFEPAPVPGSIGRANLDGSGIIQTFIPVPFTWPLGEPLPFPVDVAVDSAHVYWADWGTGTIGRANLDGSRVNQNFVIDGNIGGVAVDRQHVYWTNSGVPLNIPGSIGRANLDGSGVDQDFIRVTGYPGKVAVDDKYVYWTSPGSHSIGRANLDGTNVNENFIDTGTAATELAVDTGGTTATAVVCSPQTVLPSGSSDCNATVTDRGATPSTPSGTVTFTESAGGFGAISCTLSGGGASASCQVRYTPNAIGTHIITAHYGGDGTHDASAASTTITLLPAIPSLTNVSQSATLWRRGGALPRYASANPPVGTTFSFTLDRPARMLFTFHQMALGRRVGGACVPATKRNGNKPRCQRTVIAATLRHQAHAGRNSMHFEGRINQHQWLAPGFYTLRITATANGQRSRAARLQFTIVQRQQTARDQ